MKYRLLWTIALIIGAIGCSVNDQVEEHEESLSIVFTAAPFQDGDRGIDTRTSVIPNETYTSYAFVWSAKDTVGIYPDSGSQIYFTMSNGEGVGTASFDGGAWTCKEGHSFRSYYPFIGNFYLDETKIPVSFIGQKQVGNDNSDHFQKYDYMYTAVTTKDSGFLNFNYNHLITGVLPWVELPAGHYTGLTLSLDEALFVTKGEYDLTADSPAIVGKEFSNSLSIELDIAITSPDILKVYVPLAPMDMSGKTLTITITDENGREFQYTYNPSKRYEASKIYRLRSATSFVDDIINFADPAVKAICVENWDTDGDGELSYEEAATVTSIPYGVFSGNHEDGTVKEINSFDEFQYFTGVTVLGYQYGGDVNNYYGAFSYSELKSIKLPSSLKTISFGAFRGCQSLESITIPESVTRIDWGAFRSCSSLTDVIIPESVTKIDGYAFCGSALTSVIIPNAVTEIGPLAFSSCSSLATVKVGDSVISIGSSAFSNCSALYEINFPEGLESIGRNAFQGCSSLKEVYLPSSLTTLDEESVLITGCGAFYNSGIELIECYLPILRRLGPSFKDKYGRAGNDLLKTIIIKGTPETTNYSIPDDAFKGLSVEAFILPEGMSSIGSNAFNGCSRLQEITIQSTVESIGGWAFYNCTGLTSITVFPINPPVHVDNNTFRNTNNCPIYVPAGSVDAYKTADGWSDYADRIFAIPGTAVPEVVDLGSGVGTWASFNIGANTPEEVGSPFAWGEVETKSEFGWDTYKWFKDDGICKYYNYAYTGSIPWTGEGERGDDLIVLEDADDAAATIWGSEWRMPTKLEIDNLLEKCDWEWTQLNNVWGYQVKSQTNDNSIFLPATGSESTGYWTSSYFFDNMPPVQDNAAHAYCLVIREGNKNRTHVARYLGYYIRPKHR